MLLPFSQGERSGLSEQFPALAFDAPEALMESTGTQPDRRGLVELVLAGGFPLAVARPVAQRHRWFDQYVTQVLDADVRVLADVHLRSKLREFLLRLVAQTAQPLNVASAAASVGIAKSTGETYVELLESVFLLRRVPAFGQTLSARVAKRPKLHVVDSGVAGHLLGLSAERLLRADPSAQQQYGHLLETFVVAELAKQLSFMDDSPGLRHFRDHEGHEVDVVLERRDGDVVGVEVKTSPRVRPQDLAGLRYLRDKLGSRFRAGFLFAPVERAYRSGEDRVWVLPLAHLWRHGGP
jgi:predicted AAA+ superfamily ATPase